MLNFTQIGFEALKEELGEKLTFQLLNNFLLTYENFNSSLNFDNKNLYAYIHKLKGAAGNLKINNIFKYCLEIENNPKDINELENLKSLLDEVLKEISKNKIYFDVNNNFLSKDDLKNAISELLVDIEDFNYIDDEKIDVIINSLKEHTSAQNSELEEFKLIFAQGDYSKLNDITKKFQKLI